VAFRIEYLDGLHIMDQMVVYCECNVILGIYGLVVIRTVRATTSVWHASIQLPPYLIIHVITSNM
jgi:hypothetical protein